MTESRGWNSEDSTADRSLRILCVCDDDAAARVESLLRERVADLAFVTASTVDDALAAVEADPVDCVVTAQGLTDGTGVELAAALCERTPAPPVVLFTDEGSDDLAIEAARAGVAAYLPRDPDADDGLLARRVQRLARDARERRRGDSAWYRELERQLRALQRMAQELNVAASIDEIGEIAVEAAAEILDLDITGIWRYDERQDALVPITMTATSAELFDSQPRFERGDGLAWQVFEAGEIRVYDDISGVEERYNPETPIESEIIVPLGEQGLIITGSTTAREFSDHDADLFRTLGASVEAAMVRAQREAELRRQNERLDEFASVVSHDLRNPLSVAKGYLDLARESGDPEDFDRIEDAHDRIGRLIDDLLTLARGETVVDASDLDLADVAREAWEYVGTAGATLTIADELPTVRGDRSRLAQLFENLFRNSVEHSDGAVDVRVGSLSDRDGFYVADDGPGIPADRRDDVFDHGVSYSENGTGFGLSIVAAVVRAHDWRVSLTESEGGGARFEFETDVAPDGA